MKPEAGINELELLLEVLTKQKTDKEDEINALISNYAFSKAALEIALFNLSKNSFYKESFEKETRLKFLILEEIIKTGNPIINNL